MGKFLVWPIWKRLKIVTKILNDVLLNKKLPQHLHAADLVVVICLVQLYGSNALMKTTYSIGNLEYIYKNTSAATLVKINRQGLTFPEISVNASLVWTIIFLATWLQTQIWKNQLTDQWIPPFFMIM